MYLALGSYIEQKRSNVIKGKCTSNDKHIKNEHDKVNKWTQELPQSYPHQAPNTKGKDRQIQLSSHKINGWLAELASLFQKDGNSVTHP